MCHVWSEPNSAGGPWMLFFTFFSLGDIQRWRETWQENPELVPSIKEMIQVIFYLIYQSCVLITGVNSDLNNLTTSTSVGKILQQSNRMDNTTLFYPKTLSSTKRQTNLTCKILHPHSRHNKLPLCNINSVWKPSLCRHHPQTQTRASGWRRAHAVCDTASVPV